MWQHQRSPALGRTHPRTPAGSQGRGGAGCKKGFTRSILQYGSTCPNYIKVNIRPYDTLKSSLASTLCRGASLLSCPAGTPKKQSHACKCFSPRLIAFTEKQANADIPPACMFNISTQHCPDLTQPVSLASLLPSQRASVPLLIPFLQPPTPPSHTCVLSPYPSLTSPLLPPIKYPTYAQPHLMLSRIQRQCLVLLVLRQQRLHVVTVCRRSPKVALPQAEHTAAWQRGDEGMHLQQACRPACVCVDDQRTAQHSRCRAGEDIITSDGSYCPAIPMMAGHSQALNSRRTGLGTNSVLVHV